MCRFVAGGDVTRMADEDLRDYGYDGRWSGHSPGGGGSLSHQRAPPPHPSRAAEAEDIMRGGRGRSGLYYSPPGTSYTIVERGSQGGTGGAPPRGTYLGASNTFSRPTTATASAAAGKKRPISPEQVRASLLLVDTCN